jgi:hypothetical protein
MTFRWRRSRCRAIERHDSRVHSRRSSRAFLVGRSATIPRRRPATPASTGSLQDCTRAHGRAALAATFSLRLGHPPGFLSNWIVSGACVRNREPPICDFPKSRKCFSKKSRRAIRSVFGEPESVEKTQLGGFVAADSSVTGYGTISIESFGRSMVECRRCVQHQFPASAFAVRVWIGTAALPMHGEGTRGRSFTSALPVSQSLPTVATCSYGASSSAPFLLSTQSPAKISAGNVPASVGLAKLSPPCPSNSHHSVKSSRLAARPSRSSGSGSSGGLVSLSIANPSTGWRFFTPLLYPTRKGGDPKALAWSFPDMFGNQQPYVSIN